ncbi:MAG: phosphate/phosphite/phosphonate ABC transporter substrate-binding protein [bacterium]
MLRSGSFSGGNAPLALCLAAALAALIPGARSACAAELTFGVNPWGDAEQMKAMYRPVMEYLSENLGVEFRIVIPPTYDALVDDFVSGHIRIASLNSVTFLRIRQRMPSVRYIATTTREYGGKARDHYVGYIITLKDSPVETFDDLEGTVFGFVDIESGSGYKMPVAMLGLRGTTPESFFKKFFFVGTHDELAAAVKNRCVEAGATWDNSYEQNTKRFGEIFKIVARTPPIPNDAWAAHPSVPRALVEKIRSILLETDTRTKTAGGSPVLDPSLGQPAAGWTVRDAGFYDDAAQLLLFSPGD